MDTWVALAEAWRALGLMVALAALAVAEVAIEEAAAPLVAQAASSEPCATSSTERARASRLTPCG